MRIIRDLFLDRLGQVDDAGQADGYQGDGAFALHPFQVCDSRPREVVEEMCACARESNQTADRDDDDAGDKGFH